MRPKTFVASEHDIDHAEIDPDALYVLKKLTNAGHEAYLVGGSVRDLLLKQHPKDFDISTSAKPKEIKDLFRKNCFLIGKRFRLAHIRFGHKVVEVSTFRSGDNDSDLIIRDNTWGCAEEDALRRDFTINGLFYDPNRHTIIDYIDGWEDIHRKVLRTIGNPHIRFKQDPVRMIRLLKFRARFGFCIDSETEQALHDCQEEIEKSSTARILEEIFRMLESGSSAPFFHLMSQAGLLKLLLPLFAEFFEGNIGKKIYQFLEIADQFNSKKNTKPLARPVLASCLFFPILENEIQAHLADKEHFPHLGDVLIMSSSLIKAIVSPSFSHFPKRISTIMNSIMSTQYRLTPLSGKYHYRHKLLRNKEFPLALKFLQIRAIADETVMSTYQNWSRVYRQFLQKGVPQKTHHSPPQKNETPAS
ncbi:MAG: polynucleotide adenylyltransferase PcnB [Waddliaceae bacterium]